MAAAHPESEYRSADTVKAFAFVSVVLSLTGLGGWLLVSSLVAKWLPG